MIEARFKDERTTTTNVNPNNLNIAIPDQVLEESILHTLDKVEITSDNDARDQASEVETKVLVDGKQDDTKVVKVVGTDIANITRKPDKNGHENGKSTQEPRVFYQGSRDRPPMLSLGRYPQWRLRFLLYVDSRPNGEALRKCILSGPYKPTTVLVHAVEATDNSPAVAEHTTVVTPANMSPESKDHFLAEKEAIHLILAGIGDDIYPTPEWSRFVTIVKQQHKLDEVSYHKLFDILKQYQNEVNELRAEKLARNANPLALVATAQASQDPFYQSKRDKDMQKNLALIAKYFKKIYKPTNNNLRTSSNSKNKNVDMTPREYGHFAKECRKPKRVKDSANHKEKMLLCKQAEQGVPLQAEQYDWLPDMDEEVDEQELEAHYNYMAKIQEVPIADSSTDLEPVEQVQNKAGYNVFANHLQHSEQSESVSNTCLVEMDDSNVTPDSPDMCEDDIRNEQNDIQKQLKKANTTLAQELKECKAILAKTSKSLGESISVRDSCLVALQTKPAEFEKFKAFNDRTVDYDKLERKLNDALGQLAHKDTVIREGLKTKAYELSVVKEKHDELMKLSLLTKSHYEGLVKQKTKVITDLKLREEHDIEKMLSMEKQLKFLNEIVYKRNLFCAPTALDIEILIQTCLMPLAIKTQGDSLKFVHKLKQEMHDDLKHVKSLEKEIDELESKKAEFLDMYDVILQECVSKDVMCSYLQSLSDLDVLAELQCMYLHKVKECDCLAQRLLKQTKSVSKKVHTKLLQRFAKVEKHLISLEIALQNCKEHVKNDTVCNEKASNVFRKEREQYYKIQDLKAKLQDKNIVISELKKLIEKGKGKYVDTKFVRPSVVRQPNAQRIPKPSVLGKSIPF
nr:hypothetical protein [Tanacetum cinerariifolium]